jgi:hypothetical protein
MSRATDFKSHRKTHSENHLRRDLVRNPRSSSEEEEENHGHYLEKISSGIRAAAARRRRRRITGNDWKNFPGTAHTDRQTDMLPLLLSIPKEVLSQESKMWTFWCLLETLGCSFFSFARFCEREVEPSWVQTF